jgi:hypothetical protein
MFIELSTDPRAGPPSAATSEPRSPGSCAGSAPPLELKYSGLDADLAHRSAQPSTMSLLGLVRHLADVERGWFRGIMAWQDLPPHFSTETDRDADFDGACPTPGGSPSLERLARRGRVHRPGKPSSRVPPAQARSAHCVSCCLWA